MTGTGSRAESIVRQCFNRRETGIDAMSSTGEMSVIDSGQCTSIPLAVVPSCPQLSSQRPRVSRVAAPSIHSTFGDPAVSDGFLDWSN